MYDDDYDVLYLVKYQDKFGLSTHYLCDDPDMDKKMIDTFPYKCYFWRTDRELTNCFRCLATLREIEHK